MLNNELEKLYVAYTGAKAEEVIALPSAGSNRRYFRMKGVQTLIGVQGEAAGENAAFIYMSGFFREKGLPVPAVYAHTDDYRYYLQEDLGDVSLFDAIAKGRQSSVFDEAERELLRKTIALLPAFQRAGAQGFDFSRCYPQAECNSRSILWDLNYFKYCFLKTAGIDFQEDRLEDDFLQMRDVLLTETSETFLYRDFQSRNVMIKDGEPWFIDFQGGRRGPIYYDPASFLWQAKANFSEDLRHELLRVYLQALSRYQAVDEGQFLRRLRHFVLFRSLQVLGAYGFRGYFEKKPHFIQSIPYALENLRQLLKEDYTEYPYLCEILRKLTTSKPVTLRRYAGKGQEVPLEVSVVSFSYNKGLPKDPTGNGGGFVFDCRAIHNPGKYECYTRLTGLDEPVVHFLEEDGEVIPFLEHVFATVDASVERYIDRRFTHLMVCFGCTGGQHRSVYAAQRLAEHLHAAFAGLRIHLTHREQNIEQLFEAIL